MNIKKLFGFRSKEEKINQYRKLLQKSQDINKEIDNLADEFAQQNSIIKSISTLDAEEKEDALKRYDSFLKEHTKHVASIQKEKTSIEKSIKLLEDDTEIAEALVDMKDLFEAKGLCKSGVISKSIYNDIIKAKIGKVKYADVLLFRGDKLLILQRVGDMGESTTEWCIPGGHVDAGEEWREAAHRELFEETGLDVPEDLLYPVGIATGKDFEIHYFIGHIDSEAPASLLLDSEEEIGSAWINPSTELDDYDFIFDMKDNIKRILGLEVSENKVLKIMKSFLNGDISEKVFGDVCKSCPEDIKKANNKTYFSHTERKDLAKKGEAMPNGKYPIRNSQDLKDAIKLSGASDMPKEKVKAWIKKRAKELGLENELPEDWKEKENVEKTIDCNSVNALCKEDLDKETKEPEGDGIEKSIEIETEEPTGFRMLIDFNDLDQADMFKSLLNEMKNEGKLDINKILVSDEEIEKSWGIDDIRKEINSNVSLDDGSEILKAKDEMYRMFADFVNFIEGVKTKSKNIHWSEEDNAKHQYLDDLIEELSDYEDKIMEAGQSEFGRFKEGEINGEEIEVDDPIGLINLIIDRTKEFYSKLEDKQNYAGEKSWVEDFMATLKQTKYRLQLH